MIKNLLFALGLVLLFGLSAKAQTGNGAIKITLTDKTTKETIPFANVVAYKDGVQVGVATTNMDGEAVIKPLAPGKYTVKGVYVGYQAAEVKDVLVGDGKTAEIKIPLSNGEGVRLDEVEVITYQVPLIDPDTKSGATITREDYQNLATKDVNSVAATTAGVFQADEGAGLSVRGGRSGATTYFVDGVKVFGSPNLPQQSIEQIGVITGGVPAMYGDLTSGAISISTRGPQSKYFGGIELISSQITDPYGYNSLGFSFGGPLYKKKDSTKRTVLGFFMSGQGNYIREPNPSFVPIYVLKDEKLQEIQDAPFRPSPSGVGFVRTSEFVTKDDMEARKTRPNARARSLSLNAKIDYAPSDNTNITLGGYFDYSDNLNAGVGNQMFNSVNNGLSTSRTVRGTIGITQKFGKSAQNKEQAQSLLQNSFFRALLSYDNEYTRSMDAQHKDNIFRVGYIGKFTRRFLEKDFAYNYDFNPNYNGSNAYLYAGRREVAGTFEAGTYNPDATKYTTYLISQINPNLLFPDFIAANGGLRNGDVPQSVYSLFNNFGVNFGTNSKRILEQWRFTSSFNTDVKNHALTFGVEFDQRITSSFGVAATGLWTRMRLLANSHTESLDLNSGKLETQFSSVVPYYSFDYLYQENKQTQISESILNLLGLPKNYTGFVNTDELNPDDLKLSMFSAEDLLGNTDATNLVGYNGFSAQGERTGGKTNITNFLEAKDANGRRTFEIGSFRPIYSSVYVMDKFEFKDIKFNIGLRVDRYDANQQILKDKYAMHDLAKVGDLKSLDYLPAGFADNIPQNISKDAAVYVKSNPSNGKSPTAITGYRENERWFDAAGNEISDPSLIQSDDGRAIPLYKDRENYNKKMSAGAFTNYAAAINAMPRVAFSFPISDVANFFAHYDILTQRPTNSILSPLDYYFLDASGNTPQISNPNQRPQQTIDYELGFAQVLNERKNASITITSFYREMRNMINQRLVVGAYPRQYIMFDNIDFGTTKGLSFTFDFRRTGGSRINFNYTLQFAEGSGSNANSGAQLANSGQPNLRILQPLDFDQRHSFVLNYDYRFGSEKDYKGPSFKKKSGKVVKVLEDVGLNLSFILGSGTPYTRWSQAVPLGGRSSILGQINGSSKPWAFRTNLRIDKNIPLTFGKKDSDDKKTANLNIYLQVLNLLNNRNILNVYNYTGNPDDDGYLSSTQAINALKLANSAQAYSDLYTVRITSPSNFSLPRQIRIGVLFEF